jgi:sporulation protein YlmC with PRC-barrel domain
MTMMRKVLLSTAAAVVLFMGDAALAQQTQISPGTMPEQPGIQGQGTGTTGQGMGTGSSGTQTSGMAASQQYQSFNEKDDFDGEIAGDYEADELKDAKVVNNDGDEIGKIEDLAIGDNGRIERVFVDVSDYVDEDDHYVLASLDDLKRGEGDADDDEFVLDRSKDQLKAETAFEKSEERWQPKTSSN